MDITAVQFTILMHALGKCVFTFFFHPIKYFFFPFNYIMSLTFPEITISLYHISDVQD